MRRKSKEERSGSKNNSRINSNTKICDKKEYLASKLDLKTALKLLEDRDTESVNNSEDSSTPDDFTSPIPNVICMDDFSFERYRSSKYSDLSENGRANAQNIKNLSIELRAEKKMTGTKLNLRRNSKSPNKKLQTTKNKNNNTTNTYSKNNNLNMNKMNNRRRISSEKMKDDIEESPIKKTKLKEICDDRMKNRNGYHNLGGSMSSNNVMDISQNKKMRIISPKKSNTVINIISSESPHRDNHYNNNYSNNNNDNNNNNNNIIYNSNYNNHNINFSNSNNNFNNGNFNNETTNNTVLPPINYFLKKKYEDPPSSVSYVNETPSDQWNQPYTSPISPKSRSPLRFKTLGIYDDEGIKMPMQRSKLFMTDSQSINLDLTQLTSPVKKPPVSTNNVGFRFSTHSNNKNYNSLVNNNNINDGYKNNNNNTHTINYNNSNSNQTFNNNNNINHNNNNINHNNNNPNQIFNNNSLNKPFKNVNSQNNNNINTHANNNNNHVRYKNENYENKKFTNNNNNNYNNSQRNNSIFNISNNNNGNNNKKLPSKTFPFNTNNNNTTNTNTNKNSRITSKASAWDSYLSNCTETNHTNLIHKRDLPHLNKNDFPSKKSKSASSIDVNGSRSNNINSLTSKSFNTPPTVFVDLVSDEDPLVDENALCN